MTSLTEYVAHNQEVQIRRMSDLFSLRNAALGRAVVRRMCLAMPPGAAFRAEQIFIGHSFDTGDVA